MSSEGTLTEVAAAQGVHLRQPLIVVVEKKGASIPARSDAPKRDLSHDDLVRLELLGRGAPWAEDDDARALRRDLDERQLLGEDVGALAEPPGTLVARATREPHDDMLALVTPVPFRLGPNGYDHLDHDANVLARLSADELAAALAFNRPLRPDDAFAAHLEASGDRALSREAFDDLVVRLEACDLLSMAGEDGEDTNEGRMVKAFRRGIQRSMRRAAKVDEHLEARRIEEAERTARTGHARVRVVPVTNGDVPLLSLGLVMSYSMAHDGGRLEDEYEFVGDWMNRTIPALTGDEPPAVFLFSNYLWSHHWNLGASRTVKEKNPKHVTIHGGPDTPKYADDVQEYFALNPHVDISVHGEGEITLAEALAALAPSLAAGEPDLDALRDVPGLSYRYGDGVVTTASRDRIDDLEIVPSPIHNGLFDSVGEEIGLPYIILETNRGCPYGCTYCDWGSATLSRIRKYDLDRVMDELEWAAKHKVHMVWNADANFGVFARDVDIARKVVELKQQYGYPRMFGANYAKNTVKHLRQIVDTLVEGGILATGVLSMQSADPETLLTIRRQNIKVDRYDDLSEEFSRNELPLVTELMMGLPGSTVRSFTQDLQQCIDREMRARVYPTELLVNSPMNEPDYREFNQIKTANAISETWKTSINGGRAAPLVVSTSSFTRDDYELMDTYRQQFFVFENFGVLRQVARFVRQEAGLREMDFYRELGVAARGDRSRWPAIAFTFESLGDHLVAPSSWRFFIDEIRDYLVSVLGIADDTALDTVLAVQHALLPSRDREFPFAIELPHDFAAWHQTMRRLKLNGASQDWADKAPRLSTYGPAHFEVSDPQDVSRSGMGHPLLSANESDWEMASPVGRTLTFLQTVPDLD